LRYCPCTLKREDIGILCRRFREPIVQSACFVPHLSSHWRRDRTATNCDWTFVCPRATGAGAATRATICNNLSVAGHVRLLPPAAAFSWDHEAQELRHRSSPDPCLQVSPQSTAKFSQTAQRPLQTPLFATGSVASMPTRPKQWIGLAYRLAKASESARHMYG
jgi:hypothetical protein